MWRWLLLALLALWVPRSSRGGIEILPDAGGDATASPRCGAWSGWWRDSHLDLAAAVHVTPDSRVDRVQLAIANTCDFPALSMDLQLREGVPIETVGGVCMVTIDSGKCVPLTAQMRFHFVIRFFPGGSMEQSWGRMDCSIESAQAEPSCRTCPVLFDLPLPVGATSWALIKNLYR